MIHEGPAPTTAAGVVIPVGPGRQENLVACLDALRHQTVLPREVVVVFDGPEARFPLELSAPFKLSAVTIQRHAPGQEQPRNVGVRHLGPECRVVWFLDSDVIVDPGALVSLLSHWSPGRIVIGPYEWLPPQQRTPVSQLFNDPRWPMFREPRWQDAAYQSEGELNVGLACFSGNLLWDVSEFKRVGGFWSEIHHGRCEDGELGLRAVAEGIPISCAPAARGYHLYHQINHALALERNARDVPMLNARHPWVEGSDLFVVDRDGKRFEELCGSCNNLVNTGEIWEHLSTCRG